MYLFAHGRRFLTIIANTNPNPGEKSLSATEALVSPDGEANRRPKLG
jgi:hypothetical protein